ncbi:MAG TPA: MBL fold metallo-hydrolase [Roseimicrobium sp.]|nr:MBL fold metallo-hydrolase [Roseimicrobium sp.]
MDPVSLKCFGVGDGWPCDDRNHSSFLFRFGQTSILVDAGESLSSSYKASGLSYDYFDRMLISHFHGDHIGGFFMFMQSLWLEQRQKNLPIHMPGYGIEPVRKMLDTAMIFDELLSCSTDFIPLMARQPVMEHKVKITPFHTTHLESLREAWQPKYKHPFEAFSFLFETPTHRIAHSADIGAPQDLDPLLERPVDMLVCELSHFRRKDLFDYLRGRPIGKIVFIHVARKYWKNLPETTALAESMLGGIPFQFARDGEEILL